MTAERVDQDGALLEKRALRDATRRAIVALPPTARRLASDRVCQRIMALPAFGSARCVMLFSPLADEVDLSGVLARCRESGRVVCAPRADWEHRTMEPAEVGGIGWEALTPERHGIHEPGPEAPGVNLGEIDLIIVPGVAFDREGHRLGRGGGFYDRFLARAELRRAFLLGVGFAVQLVARVPRQDHDRPVDAVVTDGEIIVRRAGAAG